MQSQVRFNRVLEKVSEKVWETLVQSQVRFNSVSEKVPEKVWEALVQNQVRSNKWCRARSGATGFRRRSGRLWCIAWLRSTLQKDL